MKSGIADCKGGDSKTQVMKIFHLFIKKCYEYAILLSVRKQIHIDTYFK